MANVERYKVIIVGAGSAGIAVAARLAKALPQGEVALFDPAELHYYQPLFTLVGGGDARMDETVRPMQALIPRGVVWKKEAVCSFEPDVNAVLTEHGRYQYDFLVVCPGIGIDWDKVVGLREALGKGGVCSNYAEQHVAYTWEAIRSFQGGTAIFTFPSTPIKCAGAPQKIMYLAEEHFRRAGVRGKSRVIFASAAAKIFGVPKYAEALGRIVAQRGIETMFRHNLIALDPVRRLAIFEHLDTGEKVELGYDLLHAAPPMSAPAFVKQSALAAENGWVDVDKHTLQHVRFANVFSLGDASSLPTSKTGAAIRKQAPIVVQHLLEAMAGRTPTLRYDGYTSCPLVTGYGKLILAEFDYDGKPCETFPFDQGQERRSMYLLKKHVLPRLYWHGMMKGRA